MLGPATKTCDLCDGSRFEPIAQLDRHGKPLETVICRACGLVSHGVVPTEQELDDYYALDYRRDYHGERTPSVRRVYRAWRNGQRLLRQLSPVLAGGDRVFEIGAGIGCTVKAFELAGCEASGIEPGESFQTYSHERLRAPVECQRLADLPPVPTYDLVLLVHVIEHFRSPRQALEQIHRLIRPGGRLYVECPNLAAPFARRSRLFHFAHIHNFTPVTLKGLAQRCGFHVERTFSDARDPNLQMLLTKVDVPRLTIDPAGYEMTQDALLGSEALAYHLRWRYIAPRVAKLAGYVWEHLAARRIVRNLEARCQSERREPCDFRRAA